MLKPSQFVVSSDLQSASINLTLNASDACGGLVVPLSGSAPINFAGGGGGGGNFGAVGTSTD
ncbi:MAG TPA: hypothetical protein VJT78_14610 [Candidatus Dormibacteraeota bacterium]|nr:hypothetical protein [Candidatus Dormibacteraeota bacterium]